MVLTTKALERDFLIWLLLMASLAMAGPRSERTYQREKEPLTAKKLRDGIAGIIRRTTEGAVGTTKEGVIYRSEIPPSPEDVKKIQSYGQKAVPILEEYVWAKSGAQALVAVRLIGEVDGPRALVAFRRIVEHHPSAQVRIRALRQLSRTPKDAIPIARRAAQDDPDECVRRVATEILRPH